MEANPASVWAVFDSAQKKLFGRQRPIPDAMRDTTTGELETDPVKQLKDWANHYREMGRPNQPQTDDAKAHATLVSRALSEYDPELNAESRKALECPITIDELKHHITGLKNNKAMGLDGVPAELLKLQSPKLQSALLTMFNIALDRAMWPSDWWRGYIVPILKPGGDATIRGDYRPITITSVVAKLFEAILNERATAFIEQRLGLSDLQGGFRRRRGTMHQIWTLNEAIAAYRERKAPLHLCFLDVAKAYDKADHHGIVLQLQRVGTSARMINLIHQSQCGSLRSVLINGKLTEAFAVHTGVAQGAVLCHHWCTLCSSIDWLITW